MQPSNTLEKNEEVWDFPLKMLHDPQKNVSNLNKLKQNMLHFLQRSELTAKNERLEPQPLKNCPYFQAKSSSYFYNGRGIFGIAFASYSCAGERRGSRHSAPLIRRRTQTYLGGEIDG